MLTYPPSSADRVLNGSVSSDPEGLGEQTATSCNLSTTEYDTVI